MRTVLHSISYSGSWGQPRLTLDEFCAKAQTLGYDGVMLAAKRPHASLLDMDANARARLKQSINGRGLSLECLAGYTNFTADAEHAEIPHVEMQIHYVEQLCQLAVDLGGRLVRIFTGYEHPALPYSRAWDLAVRSVKECSRRAQDRGALLALQNHHDLAGHAEAFLLFLQAVDEPACRAAFDAWAVALQGGDVCQAARRLAPWTVYTTAADYIKVPRFAYQPDLVNYTPRPDYVQAVPMGSGCIDYAGFLTALQQGGYTGPVAYEMCSPLRDGNSLEVLDRYGRAFLDFIRGIR